MRQVRALWILCSILVVGLTGCGDGRSQLPTYTVSGLLTLDGKPIGGAEIWYVPKTPEVLNAAMTIRPYAKTASDGKYTLTSYLTNDGAPQGEYTVIVMKAGESDDPESDEGAAAKKGQPRNFADAVARQQRTQIPMKYSSPTLSPLNVMVKAETNVINLELKLK